MEMQDGPTFRIATYNAHSCRGLDRRTRPERIAAVLSETEADIIALQEVWSAEGDESEREQVRRIAETLGLKYCFGGNWSRGDRAYGNAVLSRWPLHAERNYDISLYGRQRRGCLRADVMVEDVALLHIFNVHLGLSLKERKYQSRKLVSEGILADPGLTGLRVVLGDFNDWTRGLTQRFLDAQFHSVDIRRHLRRARTYPGWLPIFHLDHIYYDPALEIKRLRLHRSRAALVASDHLPLVADFRFRLPAVG
ncbi:MAG TPA: endonuclease/exonuclease/phosphatase family protein [Blastocatellia bacterium]|nr:endonuclease/exonuclease/phosphatase family protein [Blastocatellia bacterium]